MFNIGQQNAQARRKIPAPQSSSLGWRKSYSWILLLIPLLVLTLNMIQPESLLPIDRIQLSGSFQNLPQQEVESILQGYIGRGFFSLDITRLQRQLRANPWVDAVSVRRIWPNEIVVRIREKKPVARWDAQNLLSDSAKVFPADTGAFGHLPLVHAEGHRPAWVLQQFYRLEARFNSVDEKLVALEVDRRGALRVELINGLQIKLGRNNIEHKVERLIAIYLPQILPRREQIERLDFRYSNGFAVAWKKAVLQGRDKVSIWSNSNV